MRHCTTRLTLLTALAAPLPVLAEDVESPVETEASDDDAAASRDLTETATSHARSGPILGAASPPRQQRAETWDAWGRGWVRSNNWNDPALDVDGTVSGREMWIDSRMTAGFAWTPDVRWRLDLEIDALSGQLAGDETDVGTSLYDEAYRDRRNEAFALATVLPRRAALTYRGGYWQLLVGHQLSSFGLGILANDGSGTSSDFGDGRQGSMVERIAFGFAPLAGRENPTRFERGFVVYASGDFVFRDDNASVLDGDRAFAANAGVRVDTDAYNVAIAQNARFQTDREDPLFPEDRRTSVDAYTSTAFGRVRLWQDADRTRQLVLEGEGGLTTGQTDRPYLDETFEDGARILSMGGVARLRYDCDVAGLTAKLELGYASGDNDPRDDVARQFSFNSDYNVGLVLFEHYMPMLTGRAIDRIADPDLIAVPPGSTRYTINQGVVQNAVYVYPTVRYRPIEALDLRIAWLFAKASGDVIDPYSTAANAGYNTTFGNQMPGSRILGHEVDFGASWTFDLPGAVGLRFGGETGVFLPGAAFDGIDGADPGTVWIARGMFDLLW